MGTETEYITQPKALVEIGGVMLLLFTCDQVCDVWQDHWTCCPLCGSEPDFEGNFLHSGPKVIGAH